ncbi:MAG: glycoside hydrolase family 127 protein, partial [Bacteroidales bacterium]|nr:glycoside hydrolase family 127 protein [Bacteroidales bacterium]
GIRCCNLNAARIAPYYVAGMWMKSENGQDLVSLLHGPSQLNTTIRGVKVTIITDTNYPFENTVNYTIIPESPVEFTLKIRNPSWSGNTKVECEGAEITLADGFYKVEKTFTEFDKVSVIFEHAITLNKLDNPDSKDFYIQRGPLVYTYPYSNEKYPIQARDGFPGYYHWNIEIPASLGSDFVSMKMHSNSNAMFERDSSFLRFQVLDTFDPQEPYAFPRGKITGRFIANRIFTERDLIPIGCAITRRTTFSPSTLISDLSPATIELDGNNEIAIGSTVQFNATVRDQENTILTNPECVWSASAGSINQQGIYTAPDSITTAIITISCGNITSEFPVNINHKLSKADEKVSQDLLAYPTITSGMLHFSRPIENQIFVYNIYGKKLLDKHDHRTQQIDLSSFSSGFYIIQTGRHVFKIYKY